MLIARRAATHNLIRLWVAVPLVVCLPGLAAAQTTTRVSVATGGAQGNIHSGWPAISADGRWVAFYSGADNLVPGDTNNIPDTFVHDRQTGTTTRVSVGPGGVQAQGPFTIFAESTAAPAITPDGRWVAFVSRANNLVAGDTNGTADVFVHDRQTGTTTRASVSSSGAETIFDTFYDATTQVSISADGRFVAFESPFKNLVAGDTNGMDDVFVRDLQAGTTTRVSVSGTGLQGNDRSIHASISADGRWVAFESLASSLVAGDTNGARDIFVRDLQAGTTTRVSVDGGGTQANSHSYNPSISAEGRWIAFASDASNLVAGDTNAQRDVFVHDRQTGTTTRVSVAAGGTQSNPASSAPAISADGRWVAFLRAYTLATRIGFLHDRETGITRLTSVSSGGIQVGAGEFVSPPAVSGDGRSVAFHSETANLVAGDTNTMMDVFVYDRADPGCDLSFQPASVSAEAAGGSGSVSVTAGAGCTWSALSLDSWLAVTSGNGSGNGAVSYAIAPTPQTAVRVGSLIIGGQWVGVTQAAAPPVCQFILNPTAASAAAAGGQGFVSVSAGQLCSWTAASDDPTWLTVTAGASATGSGTVTYSVAPKTSPGVRIGTLTIAGQVFTVTQVTRTPRSRLVNQSGTSGCCLRPPALSSDGRWLAFESLAGNNKGGGPIFLSEVFVYDTQAETTTRVSVGLGGVDADDRSFQVAISGDGRWIAFQSAAGNLVTGDTNAAPDVFLHDRQTGTTTRVSVGPGGTEGDAYTLCDPFCTTFGSANPSISADGRWLAFDSFSSNLVAGDTIGTRDIFLLDRQTGTTTRVSAGPGGTAANGASFEPKLSADGRWLTFFSLASNLIAGDTNDAFDVFLYDRLTGTVTRVSVGPAGAQGDFDSAFSQISGDGRWISFWSFATNLVPADTNNEQDVFVHDRQTGTTTRAGVGPSNVFFYGWLDTAPPLSADGNWLAFSSNTGAAFASNTDLFLRDQQSLQTTRVSEVGGAFSAISSDGRWVAYRTGFDYAAELYLYDRLGEIRSISLSGDLAFGNVVPGSQAVRTLTIANGGNSPLTVTGLSYPAGFSGSWSGTLAPGAAVDVTVTFAPVAAANYGGSVTATANQTTGATTVAISGTGVVLTAPTRLMALTGSLTFGSVAAGTTATRTLKITNSGNSVMTVLGLGYPQGFSGAWSGTVAAGASRDVTVMFAPTAMTTYGGNIVVIADQTGGGNTIGVSGTGGAALSPTVSVDRASLNFAAVSTGTAFTSQSPAQAIRISKSGAGTVTWTASSNRPWLTVTPPSGAGSATLTVAVKFDPSVPTTGTATGTITLAFVGASNALPPVNVTLTTVSAASSTAPFGSFDTPANGSQGVTGSIAVTGWALDDVAVTRVRILRDPLPGEGTALVFIGDATLVEGARPDVAATYATLPMNTRAGWGYLMLTNFLPALGNGTFRIHAIAEDASGRSTLLGSKTITCTNSAAITPTGAIDTPLQGGTVSGLVTNFGWVLSPGTRRADPPGGGTVQIVIDGVIASVVPTGWTSRTDLSTLFQASQYSGIATALGVATFDSTTLTNGVHTIAWVVTDNSTPPLAAGVGSRYFTVANGSALRAEPRAPERQLLPADTGATAAFLDPVTPLAGRRGFDSSTPLRSVQTRDGVATFDAEELDRIELRLGGANGVTYSGGLRAGGALLPLPIGARLDAQTGVFTWLVGPGFVGAYDLQFARSSDPHADDAVVVRVVLHPKGSGRVGPQTVIDTPVSHRDLKHTFVVAGWAADLDATDEGGVDAVHVWAYPVVGGAPVFLGEATYGGARPDVAAVHGDRFGATGYSLSVAGLAPGAYDIAVFAHSTVTRRFTTATTVRVTVRW